MLKASTALPRATVEESCSVAMLCLVRVLSFWSEAITDLGLSFFSPEYVLHGSKGDVKLLLNNICLTSQGHIKVTLLCLYLGYFSN